jgi:hypothetical protein
MSTKTTIQYHDGELARFHLYSECFDEPIEFLYLEFLGVPFEVQSSVGLSGAGLGSLTLRIPVKWAPDLSLGFQKAMVEGFVPLEVRNRACEVFEDDSAARTWLIARHIVFGGKSAIDLCMEGRADVVLNELQIIDGESWA